MTLICDWVRSGSDVDSGGGSTRNMESSSLLGALEVLPTELIFRILDFFMHPHQYSGFLCICQRALVLVNRILEVSEHWYTTPTSWQSATAPCVNMQRITIPPGECMWEGRAVCYGVDSDSNDPDL